MPWNDLITTISSLGGLGGIVTAIFWLARLSTRVDQLEKGQKDILQQMEGLQGEVRQQVEGLRGEVRGLRGELADMRERLARLEGRMDILLHFIEQIFGPSLRERQEKA